MLRINVAATIFEGDGGGSGGRLPHSPIAAIRRVIFWCTKVQLLLLASVICGHVNRQPIWLSLQSGSQKDDRWWLRPLRKSAKEGQIQNKSRTVVPCWRSTKKAVLIITSASDHYWTTLHQTPIALFSISSKQYRTVHTLSTHSVMQKTGKQTNKKLRTVHQQTIINIGLSFPGHLLNGVRQVITKDGMKTTVSVCSTNCPQLHFSPAPGAVNRKWQTSANQIIRIVKDEAAPGPGRGRQSV